MGTNDFGGTMKRCRERYGLTREQMGEVISAYAKCVKPLVKGHFDSDADLEKRIETLLMKDEWGSELPENEGPDFDDELESRNNLFQQLHRLPPEKREVVLQVFCKMLDILEMEEE